MSSNKPKQTVGKTQRQFAARAASKSGSSRAGTDRSQSTGGSHSKRPAMSVVPHGTFPRPRSVSASGGSRGEGSFPPAYAGGGGRSTTNAASSSSSDTVDRGAAAARRRAKSKANKPRSAILAASRARSASPSLAVANAPSVQHFNIASPPEGAGTALDAPAQVVPTTACRHVSPERAINNAYNADVRRGVVTPPTTRALSPRRLQADSLNNVYNDAVRRQSDAVEAALPGSPASRAPLEVSADSARRPADARSRTSRGSRSSTERRREIERELHEMDARRAKLVNEMDGLSCASALSEALHNSVFAHSPGHDYQLARTDADSRGWDMPVGFSLTPELHDQNPNNAFGLADQFIAEVAAATRSLEDAVSGLMPGGAVVDGGPAHCPTSFGIGAGLTEGGELSPILPEGNHRVADATYEPMDIDGRTPWVTHNNVQQNTYNEFHQHDNVQYNQLNITQGMDPALASCAVAGVIAHAGAAADRYAGEVAASAVAQVTAEAERRHSDAIQAVTAEAEGRYAKAVGALAQQREELIQHSHQLHAHLLSQAQEHRDRVEKAASERSAGS